jgi:hypothetical protein
MVSGRNVKIMVFGTFLVAGSLCLPSQAYAWWGHGGSHHGDEHHGYPHYEHYPYGSISVGLPNGYISIGYGGKNFFYGGGLFYEHRHRDYIVVPPPSGVIVYAIPAEYHKVVIDNAVYYTYNGVYYTQVPQGYQVVQPPSTVVLEPAMVSASIVPEQEEGQFTINIPNIKGGYNAVILKRSGNGFIGPQGEFYSEFPKVAQLKVMYGK